MALEIRYNKARSFENEAFRRISKILSKYFQEKKYDGLLIGNPIIEDYHTLKPDVMLFFNHGAVIIDLKDGEGSLTIPKIKEEFRKNTWTLNGRMVKAGSDQNINPFNQLDVIKKRYFRCLKDNYSKHPTVISEITPPSNETPDFFYYSNMVLFSGNISNINSIEVPYPYNRYFFISDENSLLNKLEDVSNNSKYTKDLGVAIKSIFKADPYLIDNSLIVEEYQTNSSIKFTDSQNECLKKVRDFLAQKEQKVFIIKGKEKVGKTTLISEIKNIATELNISSVETWAVTKRIATKLNKNNPDLNFTSIYSVIYGGRPILEVDTENEEVIVDETTDELPFETDEEATEVNPDIEKISIKDSDKEIEGDAVIIIDESQLLNSSPFSTDTMVFGSGHLLDDVLSFLKLDKTNRKLILIGDQNQLSYGDQETNALAIAHLKHLIGNLPISVELLTKEPPKNEIEANIDWISKSIRTETFNNFNLIQGSEVELLKDKPEWEAILYDYYKKKEPIVILTYTNEAAFDSNNFIRSNILNLPNEISKGDLLVMDNNVRIISSDPFEAPKYISNGSIIEVIEVGIEKSLEPIYVPSFKKQVVLSTREFTIKERGTENIKKILSLENYRNSKTGKLSSEEFVALKILHNEIVKKTPKANEFVGSSIHKQLVSDKNYIRLLKLIGELELAVKNKERKKTLLKSKKTTLRKVEESYKKAYLQDIQSELLKTNPLFQLANVRYAYALTVHKSLGEYFPTILLDADMSNNKGTNKAYYQWFYTGLSRAEKKAFILNCKNIHPLFGVKIHELSDSDINTPELQPTEKISFKLIESTDSFKAQYSDSKVSNDVLNMSYTIQEWLNSNKISSKIELPKEGNYLVKIKSIDNSVIVIFNFKGNGVPGKPRIEKAPYDLQLKFTKWLEEIVETDTSSNNGWRNTVYDKWKELLKDKGITWKHNENSGFQERIWLNRKDDFLTVDLWFDNAKFITTIKPFRANNYTIWNDFKLITISN